ncbi:hypothetical protein J2T57_002610 [Natronocella acetinitrilica]|uniref:Uncharacterized protein n=1 Tax=Natronocella acetinitrilica TaxID=414046 RepID=A0AAE3G457_9GAMM|nr:hypothetical protein [Natronocella acetinitrilica]MCP1675460.1 hypothetical protein [Natronocella acetinitrilica]
MARKADDYYLDGTLDRVAETVRVTVCAGEPTNLADLSNVALADGTLTAGDWAKSNASPDGRRVDMDQQPDLAIDASGEADHVVVDEGDNIYVTVCDPQMLTAGGTVTVGTWGVRVAAPAAP